MIFRDSCFLSQNIHSTVIFMLLQVSSGHLELFLVAVDPTRRYLFLHILGGKAFIEHLNAPAYPGNSADTTRPCATFKLHVLFRGQRFKSRPTPVACEPDLSEGFLLELHAESTGLYYIR